MVRIKTKIVNIIQKEGIFSSIIKKIKGVKQIKIATLRQVLSNERVRILQVIKTENPTSIYQLTKILKRDFKIVRQDIRLLEEFGFIELINSIKNGRERLQPVVVVDQIVITINI